MGKINVYLAVLSLAVMAAGPAWAADMETSERFPTVVGTVTTAAPDWPVLPSELEADNPQYQLTLPQSYEDADPDQQPPSSYLTAPPVDHSEAVYTDDDRDGIFYSIPGKARPEVLKKLEAAKGDRQSVAAMAESVALRPKAQKEAALSAGIKAGVKYRYQQIVDYVVTPNEHELDLLFNFTPLLITQGEVTAMPPIIARAGAALRVNDDGVVSFQKGSYKFVRSAAIITGAPTWRNYLLMEIAEPEELHPSIFPVNVKESRLWKEMVNEGWRLGVEQADYLFESNMAKLVRDYKGMLIYYGLSSQGLVEKPVITTTETGTHIMAKEVIYDRTLYQVTKDGRFQPPKPLPRAKPPRPKPGAVKARKKSAAKKKPAAVQAPAEVEKQPIASVPPLPPAPAASAPPLPLPAPVSESSAKGVFANDGPCEFVRLKTSGGGKAGAPCQ